LVGGKFLDRCKLYKTEDKYHPEPYQVDDFYVGARIQVFGRTLELMGTDERSQKNLSDINQCAAPFLSPALRRPSSAYSFFVSLPPLFIYSLRYGNTSKFAD
jgi:hypothetical protein